MVEAGGGWEASATTTATFGNVWTRLCDPTLPRHFKSTCWAILHGIIGVNAFIYHTLLQPGRLPPEPTTRLCSHPACLGAGAHENITHAFLHCPESAPAIDWLLQAWQLLSNSAAPPPRTAAVLLADDINAWPLDIRPQGNALTLWTRLRVCVIGAIWQVRCLRSEVTLRHESFAHHAISLAVDALTEAIKRDWARTQGDLRQLDSGNFCSAWWRGRDTQLRLSAFHKTWTRPSYFCTVEGPNDDKQLRLYIDRDQPLPFPA